MTGPRTSCPTSTGAGPPRCLRGKVVWINFWASWCPPCQQETPILRELDERYADQGLEIIGISVQETSADDVTAYAERYELDYTIGFDASGHVFREYEPTPCRPSTSSIPKGSWSRS